jgi:hypothetical protein
MLSALADLILAYLLGVVVIAVNTREFFATVLAATTVLPLMLLFVLLIPTIVIGLLVGIVIGVAAQIGSRVYVIGAVAGVLFAVAVLSGVLPLIIVTEPGNFTSIVTRPLLTGVYGLILGLTASRFFRTFSR